MANHEWETDWVGERVAGLTPGREWIPDAGRAFATLQARSVAKARHRARRWIWTTLAAACACAALLVLPTSRACAEQPGPCVLRVLGVTEMAKPVHASTPVDIEVYIDFECAACGSFVRDVAPRLEKEYVQTGKAKLVYRDYPLPLHRHAELAARYADAARELGYFDAAMKQLFATREIWSASGDVDAQVAQALPANVMDEVRARIHCEAEVDFAAGLADHVDHTPFVVVASNGKREAITDAPITFEALKNYLDRVPRS